MSAEPAPAANGADAGGAVRRRPRRRTAVAGALLVALIAVAVSSRSFPAISTTYSCGSGPCGYSVVEDCCCDYETVDAINEEVLNPILQDLVALPFFRYLKVGKKKGAGASNKNPTPTCKCGQDVAVCCVVN